MNLITVQQDATYSVYAFNHRPLFYISYSSRLVTFNITSLEF